MVNLFQCIVFYTILSSLLERKACILRFVHDKIGCCCYAIKINNEFLVLLKSMVIPDKMPKVSFYQITDRISNVKIFKWMQIISPCCGLPNRCGTCVPIQQ